MPQPPPVAQIDRKGTFFAALAAHGGQRQSIFSSDSQPGKHAFRPAAADRAERPADHAAARLDPTVGAEVPSEHAQSHHTRSGR